MRALRTIVTTGLAPWLLIGVAFAQTPEIPEVTIPRLAAHGASAEAFVPAGWRLEANARADFNGDGRPDLVFVLRQADPRNVVANESGDADARLNTNPRLLGVALADATGPGYTLLLQDSALIRRHDDAFLDDPFTGLTVRAGTFRIALRFWASAGASETVDKTFSFRVEPGCVRLVGYDSASTNKPTARVVTTSVNHLTGRVVTTVDGPADQADARPRTTALRRRGRVCLGQIDDGLAFEP